MTAPKNTSSFAAYPNRRGRNRRLVEGDHRRQPQRLDLDGYRQDVTRPELPSRRRPWWRRSAA